MEEKGGRKERRSPSFLSLSLSPLRERGIDGVRLRILHFADLHLGVESYGRINAETGLPTRLEDFLRALDQVIDYALENIVDLVLFCGDAYKSREPSPTEQREFAKRISRLSKNEVPMFLLIGNHDLPNAIGRATTTEIFDTLAVRNVHVSNRPDIYRIQTKSGVIQIASLPWLRRNALLSKEETKNLNFAQINQKLQQILTNIIAAHALKLDPTLPSILAAHVWMTGAQIGSEKLLSIGQEHALLLSNVTQPVFDYIALGHIHKHQVLSSNPPVVYAGSLERLDFSEEEDEKGFYTIEIETDKETDKRLVSFDFHPISGRRFLTINVNIEPEDTELTLTILRLIDENKEKIKDAIVRLQISLPDEMEGRLSDNDIKSALKEAHSVTIAKDIKRSKRSRLGEYVAEELTPLAALKAYLESTKVPPERINLLLEYGEKLIHGQETRQV
ncbi:exonuclease SbcCD subunit D [Chloroflexota bacterium]